MTTSIKILFLTLSLYTLQTLYSISTYAQLVSDFRVNDDTTNTEQFSAKIGVDSLGIVTSVWRDQRNNRPNVYCQRFNSNGIFLGQNFRINVNPDSSGSPAVAVAKNGMFGVCWVEINGTINNSSKVKFRLYNSDAVPITGEIVVNDTNGNFSGPLSIGVSDMNEFIITWSYGNILYQRIDTIGNKIGNNVRVNDTANFYFHLNPAISVRQDGSFIITWSDTRPPSMANADDIYMQMYDKFGNKIGVNQRVNDDTNINNLQGYPKISSDDSARFVIAWGDNRNDNDYSEVYSQKYFKNGNKNGINIRVTQSPFIIPTGFSSIDLREDGFYVISWTQFHGFIGQPYFQRFNTQGDFVGNNFLVTSYFSNLEKFASDIKIFDNKIISIWTDARNGPFDIYSNIRSFTNPDTTVYIVQTSTITPEKFSLSQNYPNPFNPTTTIEFEIIQNNIYSLDLYNCLGQNVKNIFKKTINSGTYSINFNSSGFSSGIYYYILSSPKERLVRSFVLIK